MYTIYNCRKAQHCNIYIIKTYQIVSLGHNISSSIGRNYVYCNQKSNPMFFRLFNDLYCKLYIFDVFSLFSMCRKACSCTVQHTGGFSLFSKRRIQKLYIVTHNNLQGNVTKHVFWQPIILTFTQHSPLSLSIPGYSQPSQIMSLHLHLNGAKLNPI